MHILFVPVKYKVELQYSTMDTVYVNTPSNLCIFATVQYLDQAKQLFSFLKEKGKKVFLPKPKVHALEAGQVLGCDPSGPISVAARVDAFVYIGDGKFHPLAVAYQTKKPIFIVNPINQSFSVLDNSEVNRYEKTQYVRLSRFEAAQRIGILVSTKKGQANPTLAKILEKKIQDSKKEAYIFMFDTLSPETLSDFREIDFWINTACPRIAIDDYSRFEKPIINAESFLKLL